MSKQKQNFWKKYGNRHEIQILSTNRKRAALIMTSFFTLDEIFALVDCDKVFKSIVTLFS